MIYIHEFALPVTIEEGRIVSSRVPQSYTTKYHPDDGHFIQELTYQAESGMKVNWEGSNNH